jgi:hypothetical protein
MARHLSRNPTAVQSKSSHICVFALGIEMDASSRLLRKHGLVADVMQVIKKARVIVAEDRKRCLKRLASDDSSSSEEECLEDARHRKRRMREKVAEKVSRALDKYSADLRGEPWTRSRMRFFPSCTSWRQDRTVAVLPMARAATRKKSWQSRCLRDARRSRRRCRLRAYSWRKRRR